MKRKLLLNIVFLYIAKSAGRQNTNECYNRYSGISGFI